MQMPMGSFEQLVNQYEPLIWKIIHLLKIYKNKEEFYQIGLIALWEASTRFDPEKGEFLNYAYMYMKGRMLSELTRRGKQENHSIYPKEEFWNMIPDNGAVEPLQLEYLLSDCTFARLTAHERKWVIYTVVAGLSIREIAYKENVSTSAVKKWRKGARAKLRYLVPPVDKKGKIPPQMDTRK